MLKRRAYDKSANAALATATLGQAKRSGMHKLLGKKFQAPGGFVKKKVEHGSDSDSSSDEEATDDKPFEPLVVWVCPEEGGECKGIPDKVTTVTEPDEYGIDRKVTKTVSAPESSYAKKNVEVPGVLAKWLRPHQREGLQFLYECVMSLRSFNGAGCILADDMGLGKTLQSVALILTLLKTGVTADRKVSSSSSKYIADSFVRRVAPLTPRFARRSSQPTAKRIIVTCPCSLVKNWDNEFVKWLGPGVVKTLALAEQDRKTVEKNIDVFVKTNLFNVLILSYECLRTHIGRLNKTEEVSSGASLLAAPHLTPRCRSS